MDNWQAFVKRGRERCKQGFEPAPSFDDMSVYTPEFCICATKSQSERSFACVKSPVQASSEIIMFNSKLSINLLILELGEPRKEIFAQHGKVKRMASPYLFGIW